MTNKQRAQEGRATEHNEAVTFEDRLRALIREEADRAEAQRRLDRRNKLHQRLRRLIFVLALVLGLAVFSAYMTAYVDTPPVARVLLSAVALVSVSINGLTLHEMLMRRRLR